MIYWSMVKPGTIADNTDNRLLGSGMMVLDYLSVLSGIHISEVEEINKRLQKCGLDASAIVVILPHVVDNKQYGLIVYYKRPLRSDDEMVFSEEELNV